MSFYELNAETTGYFYFRKGTTPWYTAPHFHSAVEILVCAEGEQVLTVGGERKILQAGDGCFIDSYTVHSLEKSACNMFVFLGDLQYFQPTFQAFHDQKPPMFFRFENLSLLSFLYDICEKNTQNTPARYETNEGVVKILLSEISKNTPFALHKERGKDELVCNILHYASHHLKEDLSLQRLANVFGYSHEHLSRLLHRHLNEHWNRYVGRLRVRAAHALLKSAPSCSVLEIASQCGFESPNTFYRAYKREYQQSPRKK